MTLSHKMDEMVALREQIKESTMLNSVNSGRATALQKGEEQQREGVFNVDGRSVEGNQDLVTIYQDRLQDYGFDARTLLYPDAELHAAKLAQYTMLIYPLIKPEDSVLDIGCGYGSLAPLLPPCTYMGIDLVPEFIAYATEQFGSGENGQRNSEKITFQVCDLERHEGMYDWCVFMGVLNSVPNPDQLLEEGWRKCRKGMIVDFNDCTKALETRFHVFQIGKRVEYLLSLGAGPISVHPTPLPWTIIIVNKPGEWLVKKQKHLLYPQSEGK